MKNARMKLNKTMRKSDTIKVIKVNSFFWVESCPKFSLAVISLTDLNLDYPTRE
jgi:hypothetical protein